MMGSNERIDIGFYEQVKLTTLKRRYINTRGEVSEVIKLMYPEGSTPRQYDEEAIARGLLDEMFNLSRVSGVSIEARDNAWVNVCDNAFAPYLSVENSGGSYYKNYYKDDCLIREGSGNPYANIGSDDYLEETTKLNIEEVIRMNIVKALKYRKKIDKTGRKGKPELFFKI